MQRYRNPLLAALLVVLAVCLFAATEAARIPEVDAGVVESSVDTDAAAVSCEGPNCGHPWFCR